MAVEQKPVGKEAKLPARPYTFRCGVTIPESNMREIRSHVATCEKCRKAGNR